MGLDEEDIRLLQWACGIALALDGLIMGAIYRWGSNLSCSEGMSWPCSLWMAPLLICAVFALAVILVLWVSTQFKEH